MCYELGHEDRIARLHVELHNLRCGAPNQGRPRATFRAAQDDTKAHATAGLALVLPETAAQRKWAEPEGPARSEEN